MPQVSGSSPARITAVVLAGGTSRRFGSDKLSHPVGQGTLLASAVRGLPGGVRLVVVGPHPAPPDPAGPGPAGTTAEPQLAKAVWVREDPPGGGPAAALVAGLQAALAEPVDAVLVLPGDAPQAGVAAGQLLTRLQEAGVDAVLALDPAGREQPLQLALRPAAARALVHLAGPNAGAGASARALVAGLTPGPLHHRLTADAAYDIDTPEQLAGWQLRDSAPVGRIVAALADLRRGSGRPGTPLVVALAGAGGTARSAVALALQLRTDAVVVEMDEAPDAGGQDRRRPDLVVHVGAEPPPGGFGGYDLVVDPGL